MGSSEGYADDDPGLDLARSVGLVDGPRVAPRPRTSTTGPRCR